MLGVFYCSEKGHLRDFPMGGAGRLPGKPERNAIPTKGDTMGMARAGDRFPIPATIQSNFSVHTAVPHKGAAGFFYSTYFYFILRHITKEYIIFITGVPAIVRVRFFGTKKCLLYRSRAPPFQS